MSKITNKINDNYDLKCCCTDMDYCNGVCQYKKHCKRYKEMRKVQESGILDEKWR